MMGDNGMKMTSEGGIFGIEVEIDRFLGADTVLYRIWEVLVLKISL